MVGQTSHRPESSTTTIDLDSLVSPQPAPLLAVAVLQFTLGASRGNVWCCLLGSSCLIAATMVGNEGGAPMPYRLPIAFHLVLLTLLVLGSVFDGALARWLRNLGIALAVLGCMAVTLSASDGAGEGLPPWAPWIYPPIVSFGLAIYGRLVRHKVGVFASGLILSSWLVWAGWRGYRVARYLVAGLDYIALGMLSFVLACLTSLVKGCRHGRTFPGAVK